MAKFYGNIGFASTEETRPGVWVETVKVYPYYGDLLRVSGRYSTNTPTSVNDGVNISNQLSVIGDQFIRDNFYNIRWVDMYGTKWKVTNVEVQPPRLILTIGGVYHEEVEG